MSLLDDFNVNNNLNQLDDYSYNIDKDLAEIDNILNDIEISNILVYNTIVNYNIYFFLLLSNININSNKIVKYNRYGFDTGHNLYKLYLLILDYNLRFILAYYELHSHPI